MELKSEICIVSIFGRGHWLAAELGKKGIPVTLLEISGQMGHWASEDWEGPFGFFKTEALTETQVERLFEDESTQVLPQGLSIWLKSGPLELKGPVAAHRLQQLNIPESVVSYVQGQKSDKFPMGEFRTHWLAQLSHAYSSNIFTLLPESYTQGKRQNLFASFYHRPATRVGIDKSLQRCQAAGVHVLKNVNILDLSFSDKKNMSGLEIKTDRQEIFRAEQFVWCLSSDETGMLGTKIQNHLFPKGAIEPEWAWLRYRLKIKSLSPGGEMTQHEIPAHSLVIEDLMLPWTHENFIILIRTASVDLFDAWIKIPHAHRFHRPYLDGKAQALCQLLSARLPDNQVSVSEAPQEANYTFKELGPARHPIYSSAMKSQLKIRSLSNLFYDGPEQWKCLGWEGNMAHQQDIYHSLFDWWRKKEELRIKKEAQATASKARMKDGDLT